ncbi:MAG: metallophosphoesterase family protein [Bacteroidales bacterium]|nr:metallophosphoesterase family protein [Bacteroidales bacterium]
MKVGILSDTHGFLHPGLEAFFANVDEIWHAGDIGNMETLIALEKMKPVRAVYGNIDGREVRSVCKERLLFRAEDASVSIMHIGGYPGRYDPKARELIRKNRPNLVVCGHSHILKVMYDKTHEMLFINPGAAGKFGFHQSYTAIRMEIVGKDFQNLEVWDLPR